MAKKHYCGFCGAEGDERERMLAGPCIEVCNQCIDTMYKIIHEPKPLLTVKPAKPFKERKVIPFGEARRTR